MLQSQDFIGTTVPKSHSIAVESRCPKHQCIHNQLLSVCILWSFQHSKVYVWKSIIVIIKESLKIYTYKGFVFSSLFEYYYILIEVCCDVYFGFQSDFTVPQPKHLTLDSFGVDFKPISIKGGRLNSFDIPLGSIFIIKQCLISKHLPRPIQLHMFGWWMKDISKSFICLCLSVHTIEEYFTRLSPFTQHEYMPRISINFSSICLVLLYNQFMLHYHSYL